MNLKKLILLEKRKEEKNRLCTEWNEKFKTDIIAQKKTVFDDFKNFFANPKNGIDCFSICSESDTICSLQYKKHSITLKHISTDYQKILFHLILSFDSIENDCFFNIEYIPKSKIYGAITEDIPSDASKADKIIYNNLNEITKDLFILKHHLSSDNPHMSWSIKTPLPNDADIIDFSGFLKELLL